MAANWFSAPAPVARRVRGYFAPVNRALQTPVIFDAAEQGGFNLDAPPAPWISLGWIHEFTRKTASKTSPVLTGIPAATLAQVRETLEAQVSFQFMSWTKLTMALATGSQHMNLLVEATGDLPAADGAQAVTAVTPLSGSTATAIVLASTDAAKFTAGSMIALDVDYTGQTGYVGAPVAGAYVRQPLTDVDYVRRVTFNVALVSQVNSTGLTLAEPLTGGAPAAGAKVQAITGFVDREGGSFYQEWSALFVMQGSQGERIFFYYPRLQTMAGAEEAAIPLDPKNNGGHARMVLKGQYLALPITDPLDGERVLCYRSFLPAANSLV
ncbi:MAG TPA: hypothetical protein VMW15_05310 [Terracidiphilus sp.]|nr:hypothetical protein [Terracidiphilus sp.]HUX27158.1 hypothetical protein [Terracidiphilus sp.]